MTDFVRDRSATLWIVLLTAASLAISAVLACATPYAALAAVAAAYMSRRANVLLAFGAWATSQALGFCTGSLPLTGSAFGWSVGIALAAIVGAVAASGAARQADGDAPRLLLGYLAGFAAFKVAILAWGALGGDLGHAMDLHVLLRQFVRNGAIALGLVALYHALTAAGVPATRPALN